MLAIGAGAWLATSLPWHGRDLTATGVAKPVEIVRDAHGVPHIFADTDDDAYFALGLVHAQDRFWQMEMMRRFGAGRLAEVFGPEAVASDKWMRLLGLHGLAERMVGDAAPPVRRALEAYADGVNAWLAHDIGLLAPELALFRYAPEPWRPADSLVWGKIMAARLSGNWRGEALRARLAKKLPPARVRELWPAYPADGPLSVARVPGPAALYAGLDALAPWPAAWPRGASNAWAVAPERTTTGGAILANDPHLGFGAPILWYLARIEAPGFSVTGATVPGVPFMILGHTDRIAWGMTTTQSDLEDLFVEKIDANEPDRYVTATGSCPFYRRKEVIKVKGAPDVVFTARATDHGPVISDLRPRAAALAGDGHVISLAATYLQPGDRSADAFFGVNRAKDWQAFRAALAHFQGPQQNFLYADTAGHIGFLAAGKVPVRGAGRGFVPTAGWTGETDWRGFVPFGELPTSFDPETKTLINANNRVVGDAYPHFLGFDWAPPFRARRIAELLAAGKGRTVEDTGAMQRDTVSLMAVDLLGVMGKAAPETARAREAVALLRNWDGEMAGNRVEPTLFMAWLLELNKALYGDELGADLGAYLGARPLTVRSLLTRRRAWCDDVASAAPETCADILRRSLDRSVQNLVESLGPDMSDWRWDELHLARFPHPVLTHVPVLNRLADLSVPTGGGTATLNRGAMHLAAAAPFTNVHGAGFRAVYDLANLGRSRFAIATGQSGNPLSPGYRDQLEGWANGRYLTLGLPPRTVRDQAASTMTVRPAGAK